MKWNSVRVRLSLWNSGVLAVALSAFALAIGYSVQANVSHAVDRDLMENAHRGHGPRRHGPGGPPFGDFHGDHRPGPDFGPDHDHGDGFRPGVALSGHLDDRPGPGPNGQFPGPGQMDGPMKEPQGWSDLDAESRKLMLIRRPRFFDTQGNGFWPGGTDHPWDQSLFRRSLAGETAYKTITAEGYHLRILSLPRVEDGQVVGVDQFAHELTEVDRLRAGMITTILTILPLALLVAAGGGLFLTDRALRPVRAVTKAAAQISVRDLSHRLLVQGGDELAELASTFNGMLARLEESFRKQEAAYEQLRRFTADVSHELRTPLTRLKGITSLALSSPDIPNIQADALRIADGAADTMDVLIKDLLLLARSDSGQLNLSVKPVDLRSLLRDIAATGVGPDARKPALQLPDEPLPIQADPLHLTRLFSNLLENAVRHTPERGAITLTARRDGERILASVTDTGEGIAPEHLPHLFERFYRVDQARDRASGGTGLGLSLVQSIAHAHGGTLEIESEVGRGTTVTLILPISGSGQEAAPTASSLSPATAAVSA